MPGCPGTVFLILGQNADLGAPGGGAPGEVGCSGGRTTQKISWYVLIGVGKILGLGGPKHRPILGWAGKPGSVKIIFLGPNRGEQRHNYAQQPQQLVVAFDICFAQGISDGLMEWFLSAGQIGQPLGAVFTSPPPPALVAFPTKHLP